MRSWYLRSVTLGGRLRIDGLMRIMPVSSRRLAEGETRMSGSCVTTSPWQMPLSRSISLLKVPSAMRRVSVW